MEVLSRLSVSINGVNGSEVLTHIRMSGEDSFPRSGDLTGSLFVLW